MSNRVSVVIPAYNAADHIAATVESVIAQTVPAWEILVIDDGSTDDTGAVVRKFGDLVRLYSVPNAGVSAARNLGIDQASGEWIALLDSDDLWHPRKLERFGEFARSVDGPALLFSDYQTFGLDEEHHRLDVAFRSWRCKERLLVPHVCVLPSAAMFRRCSKAHFPEWAGNECEDSIFFNDIAAEGGVIHIPEPLTLYRRHESSAQHQGGSRERGVENLYRRYGHDSKDRKRLFYTLLDILERRKQTRSWIEFDYYLNFLSGHFPEQSKQLQKFHFQKRFRPLFSLKDRIDSR